MLLRVVTLLGLVCASSARMGGRQLEAKVHVLQSECVAEALKSAHGSSDECHDTAKKILEHFTGNKKEHYAPKTGIMPHEGAVGLIQALAQVTKPTGFYVDAHTDNFHSAHTFTIIASNTAAPVVIQSWVTSNKHKEGYPRYEKHFPSKGELITWLKDLLAVEDAAADKDDANSVWRKAAARLFLNNKEGHDGSRASGPLGTITRSINRLDWFPYDLSIKACQHTSGTGSNTNAKLTSNDNAIKQVGYSLNSKKYKVAALALVNSENNDATFCKAFCAKTHWWKSSCADCEKKCIGFHSVCSMA